MLLIIDDIPIIHSYTGLIHTILGLAALILGSGVLFRKKGTLSHKRWGYAYTVSMLLLNGTAFGIYNFNGFSLFHGFAVLSLATLFFGLHPAIHRGKDNWLEQHFYFMNWSVIGLYCAFVAEIGVRFFEMRYFWWVVMLATIIVSVSGALYVEKEKENWSFKSENG